MEEDDGIQLELIPKTKKNTNLFNLVNPSPEMRVNQIVNNRGFSDNQERSHCSSSHKQSSFTKHKLQLFVIIAYMIYTPFVAIFRIEGTIKQPDTNLQTRYQWQYITDAFIIIIIIIELWINFQTGYYTNIRNVMFDRNNVVRFYLQLLFVDICGLFSVIFSFIHSDFGAYIRLINLSIYDQIFQQTLGYQKRKYILAIYKLLKITFIIFIFCNFLACMFFLIDYKLFLNDPFIKQNNLLWLVDAGDMPYLIDWPLSVQYLYALFWSVITTNGIADGNIYPGNYYEVLFLVIILLLLFIFFGYFLNSIFSLLSYLSEDYVILEQKMKIMTTFLRDKHIGQQINDKVLNYLSYYWSRKQQQQQIIKSLQKYIPKDIRKDLNKEISRLFFKNASKIFPPFQSQNFQLKIALDIKQSLLPPGELLYSRKDQIEDPSIYFIQKGRICIIIETLDKSDIQFTTCKQTRIYFKGQIFNSYSFLSGNRRQLLFRVQKIAKVLSLKRSDFLKNLDRKEKDMLVRINDRLYSSYFGQYFDPCPFCKSYRHLEISCQFLHLTWKVKRSKEEERENLREEFVRKGGKMRVVSGEMQNRPTNRYVEQWCNYEFDQQFNIPE